PNIPKSKEVILPDLDRVNVIELAGHAQEIGCAGFSRDGKLVATGCYDRKVRVFDVSTGRILDTFTFCDAVNNKPNDPGVRQDAVAFDPEGKKIVAAGGNWISPPDSLATVFDLTTKKVLFASQPHFGTIWAAAFSPDAKFLVT